jgi:hypothetical protein
MYCRFSYGGYFPDNSWISILCVCTCPLTYLTHWKPDRKVSVILSPATGLVNEVHILSFFHPGSAILPVQGGLPFPWQEWCRRDDSSSALSRDLS